MNEHFPRGAAPRVIALGHAEAHVWRVRTHGSDLEPERALDTLSSDERERALRLRRPDAGAEFIIARSALRAVLGRYTGVAPAALVFAYEDSGKPSLLHPAGALRFSVSHAAGLALIAVAHGAIGVDIEPVRARRHILRVARRLLGEETAALLDRLPAPESDAAFMHAWTQREAFVKATGGTLFQTTDPLVFRWPRPLTAEQQAVADATWTIVPCAAGEGRAATVVAAGEIASLRIFDFVEIDSL